MKKNKTIFAGAVFIAFIALATITGCSKSEDNTDNNTVADSYVGIWNAKDTTYLFSGGISTRTFNFSVAKKDANNIYLINFTVPDTGVFLQLPLMRWFIHQAVWVQVQVTWPV